MGDARDLIVIGAGAAGLSAASLASRVGARVTLVEANRIGGDCTWTGCIPSKTLIHVAAVAHRMRRAKRFGLPPVEPKVEFAAVMDHVRTTIERIYAFESPDALAAFGIDLVRGVARFRDPWAIDVDGRVLRGRRFVIATGARPVIPHIAGLAETPYVTYETIFDLTKLPLHLLVLGAGPVGLELGQAFRRLGSRVTILDRDDRILSIADPEASAVVARRLSEEGVTLRTGVSVDRVTTRDDSIVVTARGTEYIGVARTMHVYPTYGVGIQQMAGEAMLDRLTAGWRGRLLRAATRLWIRATSS